MVQDIQTVSILGYSHQSNTVKEADDSLHFTFEHRNLKEKTVLQVKNIVKSRTQSLINPWAKISIRVFIKCGSYLYWNMINYVGCR